MHISSDGIIRMLAMWTILASNHDTICTFILFHHSSHPLSSSPILPPIHMNALFFNFIKSICMLKRSISEVVKLYRMQYLAI